MFHCVLVRDTKAIPIELSQKEDAAADRHMYGPKNRSALIGRTTATAFGLETVINPSSQTMSNGRCVAPPPVIAVTETGQLTPCKNFEEITVQGSSTVGLGVMPSLIQGFANVNGLQVARNTDDKNETRLYQLRAANPDARCFPHYGALDRIGNRQRRHHRQSRANRHVVARLYGRRNSGACQCRQTRSVFITRFSKVSKVPDVSVRT
jgi:hypothetical protein